LQLSHIAMLLRGAQGGGRPGTARTQPCSRPSTPLSSTTSRRSAAYPWSAWRKAGTTWSHGSGRPGRRTRRSVRTRPTGRTGPARATGRLRAR
jgi:hypothetical protein